MFQYFTDHYDSTGTGQCFCSAFGIGRGQDGTCQKSHPPGHTFVSDPEPFPKKKPLEELEVLDGFCCPPFLSQDSRCFSFVHILGEMIKAELHFAIHFLVNLVVYSSLLDGFFITTSSKSSDFEHCTSLDIKSNDAIGSKTSLVSLELQVWYVSPSLNRFLRWTTSLNMRMYIISTSKPKDDSCWF